MSRIRRVSVSDWLALYAGNRLVMTVDGNGLRRGVRELWPFGGGVSVEPSKLAELTGRKYDAREFEGNEYDLRLWMPEENIPEFRKWLGGLPVTNADVKRELAQEARQCRVPLRLLRGTQIDAKPWFELEDDHDEWSYSKRWRHLNPPVKQVPTVCFGRTFIGKVPDLAAQALRKIADGPDPMIDLVTPEEILRGRSARGNDIPEECALLLIPPKLRGA